MLNGKCRLGKEPASMWGQSTKDKSNQSTELQYMHNDHLVWSVCVRFLNSQNQESRCGDAVEQPGGKTEEINECAQISGDDEAE